MSWVDENLAPGETVLHRTKPKWTVFLHWRFLIPILGQIGLLRVLAHYLGSESVVTSRRLIGVNKDLIGREVLEINLVAIESMQVKQGLFEKIGNEGTVLVGSASGAHDIEFMRVSSPMEFRRQALAAIDLRQG